MDAVHCIVVVTMNVTVASWCARHIPNIGAGVVYSSVDSEGNLQNNVTDNTPVLPPVTYGTSGGVVVGY